MFYNIKQYGKVIRTHNGPPILTETVRKLVVNQLVKKAKEAIDAGDMVSGAFDVEVCKTSGDIVNSFLCGTDY